MIFSIPMLYYKSYYKQVKTMNIFKHKLSIINKHGDLYMSNTKNNEVIRVGILSDTHGVLPDVVTKHLTGCDYILHAGDVTSEWILDELRQVCRQLIVVRGNCDYDPWAFKVKSRQLFDIGGLTFLMVHDNWDVGRLLTQADVVVHGHTHVWQNEWRNGRLWFNPGSVGRPRYGAPPTFAIMEIKNKQISVEQIVLDMEDIY